MLSEDNPIRRQVKWIIEWPVFEYGVIVTIIANCVVLAMEEHLPGGDRTRLAQELVSLLLIRVLFFGNSFPAFALLLIHGKKKQEVSEPYFLAIFCVEASVKILAMGFALHPGSYLRSVWNIMDFIVVVTGSVVAHTLHPLTLFENEILPCGTLPLSGRAERSFSLT